MFIPKADKSGAAELGIFIPICLAFFVLKTLERVLDSFTKDNLSPWTIAKTPGSALLEVVSVIEKSLENEEYTEYLIGIEGAFNKATTSDIKDALVSTTVSNWIKTTMGNHCICNSCSDVSNPLGTKIVLVTKRFP